MSSETGKLLKVNIFGESHGRAIGVVIDGLPAGEEIDEQDLSRFMARRAGGKTFSTPRKEEDKPVFLSGMLGGKTTGAPLCAIIENKNFRPDDYSQFQSTPRPSHADYPAYVKYDGFNDQSGGGHFSGRLTAPLCIAGGICMQILERRGIRIGAHIAVLANVGDTPFDPCNPDNGVFDEVKSKEFPVISDDAGAEMREKILDAMSNDDSVGGIVECAVTGLPVGIGAPMFGSVESRLSAAIFGIGAVRGIDFGAGFSAAYMRGSEHNDPYYMDNGCVKTRTNNHGGVIGGITSGMPIIFQTAFKPTPSIGIEQDTVDLATKTDTKIKIGGRHDPCIVPRAVPCVEAATAVTLLDILLENNRLEK